MASWLVLVISSFGLAVATFVPAFKVLLPPALPFHPVFHPPLPLPPPAGFLHPLPPFPMIKKHFMYSNVWKFPAHFGYYPPHGPRNKKYRQFTGYPTRIPAYRFAQKFAYAPAPGPVASYYSPRGASTAPGVRTAPVVSIRPSASSQIAGSQLTPSGPITQGRRTRPGGRRSGRILNQRQIRPLAIRPDFVTLPQPSVPKITLKKDPKVKPLPKKALKDLSLGVPDVGKLPKKILKNEVGPSKNIDKQVTFMQESNPALIMGPTFSVSNMRAVPDMRMELPRATDVLFGSNVIARDPIIQHPDAFKNGKELNNKVVPSLSLAKDIPAHQGVIDAVVGMSHGTAKLSAKDSGLNMIDLGIDKGTFSANSFEKRKVNGADMYSVKAKPSDSLVSGVGHTLGSVGSLRVPGTIDASKADYSGRVLDQGAGVDMGLLADVRAVNFRDNVNANGNLGNIDIGQTRLDANTLGLNMDVLGINVQPVASGISLAQAVDMQGPAVHVDQLTTGLGPHSTNPDHKILGIKGTIGSHNADVGGMVRVVGQNNLVGSVISNEHGRNNDLHLMSSDLKISDKSGVNTFIDHKDVKLQAFVDSHGVTRILNKKVNCFDEKLGIYVKCD